LVGLWIAHRTLDTVEEMIQQPGCPNLYWALTDLPAPLVDVRKSVQGQRALLAAVLRRLRDDAPKADAELEQFLGDIVARMNFERAQAGAAPHNPRAALRARVRDAEGV